MLTEAERAQLEQQASLFGLSLSEFVRRRTLGLPMPATAAEQRTRAALATALLRLGVNLNQIAHHMNAGRSAPSHLPELITDIRTHVDRLTDDEPRQNRTG
jgi:Bacterial mobilisation protein (MobC).